MTSAVANYSNFSGFGVTYNLILYPKIYPQIFLQIKILRYCKKKKNRDCKIYLPFSHYKGNGFEFQRIIEPKKNHLISISLFDNDKKIKTTFIHNFREINY